MFSSILPNASSSTKFVQNGHPKTPSRFSVRVFRNPTASVFAYPMAAKVDPGYRSVQQPEQQRYVSSNHNISYDARLRTNNYAIYPGASNDTYIYEQSSCSKSDIFSNSEEDTLSTATFSPAMSTDSTLTLRSPTTPERLLEERVMRPATPATPSSSSYAVHGSTAPQPPIMSRNTSNHHTHESAADTPNDRRSKVTSLQGHSTTTNRVPISSAILNNLTTTTTGYNGQLPSRLPVYAPSTISELEVEERDRIAKINAEYNSVSSSSSSSYYSNHNIAVGIESNVRRMSPNQSTPDTSTRVTSSQPLHPNLHFQTKSDKSNHTFNPNPAPSVFSTKDGSPPLVERVPSQVEFPPTIAQLGHFLPAQAQDSWNRDGVYHSDHTRVLPYPPATSNHSFDNGFTSLPRSAQTTCGTSQEITNPNEYSRPLPVPPEVPRQRSAAERRPSVAGPRPDANVLKSSADLRHRSQTAREFSYEHSTLRRDASTSPREMSTLQPSSRGLPSRAVLASEMRRDTRTPAPRESNDCRPAAPTRHDSYLTDAPNAPVEPRFNSQHPADTRDLYKPPLTSSPTQLHLTPSEPEASKPPARSHVQPAVFVGPTETEWSNDRIRTRLTSFTNSTRPNLPPMNHLDQQLSPAQQSQTSGVTMSDPRRISEQDKQVHPSPLSRTHETSAYQPDHVNLPPVNKLGQQLSPSQQYQAAMSDPRRISEQDNHVHTSPPSIIQETSVYHSDYVELERRNGVRGSSSQAVYNSQPTKPSSSWDVHSQCQKLPIGQPSSKSNDRAPSFPTINSRNNTQDVPSSRSRTSEVPASHGNGNSSLPSRGATAYDKSFSVKAGNGGYSSSSNSSDQGCVPPEQPPQRRYSDGDQNPPPRPVELSGRSSAPLVRSVRWTENLICPSPVLASQRRKGWFNRRGDQLWTNDGVFKPPPVGQEYPSELDDYPEHGEGWMNEENIRIDMSHRLVPKPPLRSALKQSK